MTHDSSLLSLNTETDLNLSMACAIREAYAATLTVVILVEDQPHVINE